VDGRAKGRAGEAWKRWAFSLVPAVGLLELFAHGIQTCSVVPARDWQAARAYVAAQAKPEDLIAFAPRWTDPLGREYFGPDLATVEREARADESRFPRAFEVSIRGAHSPALEHWKALDRKSFGRVSVTALENPAFRPVIDDLVAHVDPLRLRVSIAQGDHEAACPFGRGPVQTGSLGFGPAIPGDRFACQSGGPTGGAVGVSVAADMDYYPRRCIYAPPPGGPSVLRLRFSGVRMGQTLAGHHGLYVEAERAGAFAPVTLTVRAGDAVLGQVVHRDREGWKPFEFDTRALAGTSADVVFEIGAPSSEQRKYCFEATTR
jgi:hypothetical protein